MERVLFASQKLLTTLQSTDLILKQLATISSVAGRGGGAIALEQTQMNLMHFLNHIFKGVICQK